MPVKETLVHVWQRSVTKSWRWKNSNTNERIVSEMSGSSRHKISQVHESISIASRENKNRSIQPSYLRDFTLVVANFCTRCCIMLYHKSYHVVQHHGRIWKWIRTLHQARQLKWSRHERKSVQCRFALTCYKLHKKNVKHCRSYRQIDNRVQVQVQVQVHVHTKCDIWVSGIKYSHNLSFMYRDILSPSVPASSTWYELLRIYGSMLHIGIPFVT